MKTQLLKSVAGLLILHFCLSACAQATDLGTVLIFCCDNSTVDPTKPDWSELIVNPEENDNFIAYFSDLTNDQYALDAVVLPPGDDMYQVEESAVHPGSGGSVFLNAVMALADEDLDFSLYDLNNNGYVDKVLFVIIHHTGYFGIGGFSVSYEPDGVNINSAASSWVQDNERDCYSKYFSLIAHENNHLYPVIAPNMVGFDTYYGLGGFDNMAGGGFADSVNGVWYPSMVNPYHRIYKDFIDPLVVDSCLINQQIDDYLTTNTVYKIPSNIMSSQYFLVTNHMREVCWEWLWPAKGMLIWHINTYGACTSRNNERVDIEAYSGNYDWEYSGSVNIYSELEEQDVTVELWNNTNTPNANSGYDSLDFWWSGTTQAYYPLYPQGKVGSQFFFYRNGGEFNKDTNPNSNFIQSGSQSLVTNIGILNITQDEYDNLYADLVPNCIYSNITQNTTWDEDALVMNDITIAQNATLTIEPGVTIYFAPDAGMTVYGSLIADGENSGTQIDFKCGEEGEFWDGITIDSSSAVTDNCIKFVGILDADIGLAILNCDNVDIIENIEISNCF